MFVTARVIVRSVLLVVLALALLLGLRGLPSATAEGESAPTVVRELSERRTQYASTYLLSNGAYRSVFSQAPVNFKGAEGRWRPIDTDLVPTADGGYETAATPVAVRFASSAAAGDPVTLTSPAGQVGLDLLGAREDAVAVSGDVARYPAVLPATDLVYEATGDGLKETIVLASAAAPESFTFAVRHAGLALRRDALGEWGLYAEGAEKPALLLGPVNACDASRDEAGEPAWCDGAKMTVVPGAGASTVTLSVPRAWLADPARVWPVAIDPQLFTRNPTDTYVAAGYPNTPYGSSEDLLCGEVSEATGNCRTLVKFPQLENISAAAHISAATFAIRQYWQPASPHNRTHVYRVGVGSTAWGEATTWSTLTLADSVEINPDGFSPSGATWLDVGCPGVVQGWVRGDWPNKGFCIRQQAGEGASYARKFRSGEYADADFRPQLTVDWEQPTMSSSSPSSAYVVGDTVRVTVGIAGVARSSQVTGIRMGVNRTAARPRTPVAAAACSPGSRVRPPAIRAGSTRRPTPPSTAPTPATSPTTTRPPTAQTASSPCSRAARSAPTAARRPSCSSPPPPGASPAPARWTRAST